MTDIPTAEAAIGEMALAADRYLDDGLLPLWTGKGWDAGGCLEERLDAEHRPIPLGYHRLMVAGRQLFVFSRAAALYPGRGYDETAHRIAAYLMSRFWDRAHGGWYFSIDDHGAPLDRRKDLYGHAFAVFGLAHYHAVLGDREALERAAQTVDIVFQRLSLSNGWLAFEAREDWTVGSTELIQNPHMHLLEALLALHHAAGNRGFLDQARILADVFRYQLFDPRPGVLAEFRDEKGAPDPQRGNRLEPGHHYEWHWLLHEFADADAGGAGVRSEADRLFGWAEAFGHDRSRGGVYDQVNAAGAVLATTKRIWPQTECLKAYASRYRQTRENADLQRLLAQHAFLFQRYLLPDGGWNEALGETLVPVNRTLPTSTCYHIVMALLEILRTHKQVDACKPLGSAARVDESHPK